MIRPEDVPQTIRELEPYFKVVGEVQVIDFSVKAPYGPWAKFRVDDIDSLDGFEPGQRYHIMLVQIGDMEMPAAADPESRKAYKLSQISGMLCVQPEFWQWISEAYDHATANKDEAAAWLRSVCNVESRSLFDSDQVAGETFRKLMAEYDEWRKTR